jgi:UDP:flavonoid glycosyltransferase YjiC (YdhE family)
MKLLFTTAPLHGHFHPLVPLADAGMAKGYDVLVATGRAFGDWVSACGLAHAAAGRDGPQSLTPEERARADQLGARRGPYLFTTVFAPPMTRDLVALCRAWKPDVIVHEESEFAGPLVGSLLGIPCVTHSYAAPARPGSDQTWREMLATLWREFTAEEPRLTGDMYLDGCPPAFQTDAVREIPNVRATRPIAFDGPPAPPPPWIAELKHPTAYVTFGTVPAFSRLEVFERVLGAIADIVENVVVTSGPPDALAAPANVIVEQYLPQSLVLGSADVVISHGGAGTTLGAIQHGLPHVVLPQQPFSQLRNAQRIEELGIGVHLPHERADTNAIRTRSNASWSTPPTPAGPH